MNTNKQKIYFKTNNNNWIYWHTDLPISDLLADKIHLTLRLAGNKNFLLTKLMKLYWEEEWTMIFTKVLTALKEVGNDWFSPFVMYYNTYITPKKNIKQEELEKKEEVNKE